MKQQQVITVDNYKDFKPSEFVRSFTSDIDVAIKTGKTMDMGSWYGNGCLPCLGGMACMNFGISRDDNQQNNFGYKVSALGDAIRRGDKWDFLSYLRDIYPDTKSIDSDFNFNRKSFYGKMRSKKRFAELKEQVNNFADALEKEGL